MKAVLLKTLVVKNFKGAKDVTINFDTKQTTIGADNGKGKTTILDAYLWLLSDKNSEGQSNFNIKPLDVFNQVIHKLESSVKAIYSISDIGDVELKKVYKEKWTTPRGESVAKLTGHVTDYYIDEVPKKKAEYEQKLAEILTNDERMKLISDVNYFNSGKFDWKNRRKTLIAIARKFDDKELAKTNKYFVKLFEELGTRTLDEYKTLVNSQRLKLKKEADEIDVRINEVKSNKVTNTAHDFADIKKQLTAKEKELKQINKEIEDESEVSKKAFAEKTKVQTEIFELTTKMQEIENQIKVKQSSGNNEEKNSLLKQIEDEKNKKQRLALDIDKLDNSVQLNNDKIETFEKRIEHYTEQRANLKKQFLESKAKEFVFDDKLAVCPECLRKFEDVDIETTKTNLLKTFNLNKGEKLVEINEENKSIKAKALDLQEIIDNLKAENKQSEESKGKLAQLVRNCDTNGINFVALVKDIENEKAPPPDANLTADVDEIKTQIAKKEKIFNKEIEATELVEQKAKRDMLIKEIDSLKDLLTKKDEIERADKRIDELNSQYKKLYEQVAEKERTEFLITKFEELKSETIENEVNKMFAIVKFKLFKTNINGTQEPTCETLVKGVPYSDLNTASRINAGVDIINTVSEFIKLKMPIFVDNAESVSVILPTTSQLIRLEKVTGLKELKVN